SSEEQTQLTEAEVEAAAQAALEKRDSAANEKSAEAIPESTTRETVRWVKTLSSLPDKDFELATAHDQARKDACEALPVGEAVLVSGFQPYLTRRDCREYAEDVPALSTRRPIFSVGLDMYSLDKRDLPTLSGRKIVSYMDNHYICLQVRIQKEPVSEELFLHHRPIACVAKYKGTRLTQEPTQGIASSLGNYRSLGLFLPEGERPTPSNLRTLVLLHRGEKKDDQGVEREKFEFVFIRARRDRLDPEKLELHTFATTNDRTVLHHLNLDERPNDTDDCSIKTMVQVTEYSHAGLYPSETATRDSQFNDKAVYSMAALESYAENQAWEGGPLKNLNLLLDDLIDSKVPSSR
ncbi:MAG: hypothetical protein RID07_06520, partial [Lacipirellulaceae bacterium]